jgi:hypothetical protein
VAEFDIKIVLATPVLPDSSPRPRVKLERSSMPFHHRYQE